jgi:hypothetical protein
VRRAAGAGRRGRQGQRDGGRNAPRVRDRSWAVSARLRKLNCKLAARTGQGNPAALHLSGEAGELAAHAIREARRRRSNCVSGPVGRHCTPRCAAEHIKRLADRAGKVCEQITKRLAGEIANPTSKIPNFNELDPRQQTALVTRKWPWGHPAAARAASDTGHRHGPRALPGADIRTLRVGAAAADP